MPHDISAGPVDLPPGGSGFEVDGFPTALLVYDDLDSGSPLETHFPVVRHCNPLTAKGGVTCAIQESVDGSDTPRTRTAAEGNIEEFSSQKLHRAYLSSLAIPRSANVP